MSKGWRVMERYPVQRGNLTTRAATVWGFRVSPHYPEFGSAADARRALMESLDPALKGASDEHIKRHYQPWQRNVKAHKVQRIKEQA